MPEEASKPGAARPARRPRTPRAPAPAGASSAPDAAKPVEKQEKGKPRQPVNQCEAEARTRNHEQCRQPAVPGKEVCHYHGGKTPSGADAGAFVHGRRSKFADVVPQRYRAGLEAGLNDPELISMKEDIALIEERQRELLRRLQTGESGALWRRLLAVNQELTGALRAGDIPALQAALSTLNETLRQGASEGEIWQEYLSLTAQKNKLAISERRREESLEKNMSVELLSYIFARIDYSIRNNVASDKERAAIGVDLRQLVYEVKARATGGV